MKIAIVGAGFSGLLLAIQLLRRSTTATIILIETASEFVRASNMSAFPEDPNHFVNWLALHTPSASKSQSFVPRHLFGMYLQTLLRAALDTQAGAGRLIIVPDEVTGLENRPDGIGLRLGVGRVLDAGHVVLATGNLPPHDLPGLEPQLLTSYHYTSDPWIPNALAAIQPADRVLLIGMGLTAIDVLLGLDRRGHRGPVVAISRRGLPPRRHADVGPVPARLDVPVKPHLSNLLGFVRREARACSDWRAAADGLRPHVQRLWRDASPGERSRFLRHLRPWWDVHRHRIAPPVAAAIDALIATGRFSLMAGKIQSAKIRDGAIDVVWRARGQTGTALLQVDRVINCTGPAGNVLKVKSPLLPELITQGLARSDPQGLGLEVDIECRVITANGRPNPHISAIGPMSRGAFWEVTAVPDIRVQANMLAERLA
jgi:uncharacterized NAD(P)/FAD-binding protein YdhS